MKRDLTILSVLALASFAVLIGLGIWQMQRLAWKEGLIARIESRTQAEPVSLQRALQEWGDTGDIEYLRVKLTGSFLHEHERHLYSLLKGQSGWHIITPFKTPNGALVMVNRGFVPDQLKSPQTRAQGQVSDKVTLVGLARAPGEKGYFTPDNDAAKNTWYWRDLVAMAPLQPGEGQSGRLVPFFVDLEQNPVPGSWPKGGVTRVELPNKHLQYAGTWFGLAGVLLVVFCIYIAGRIRRRSFT